MSFATLISPAEVAARIDDTNWAIVDCRFALAEPAKGRRDYLAAHIPSAVYAHLDEDLSGPLVPGKSGRHPLPALDVFGATLSAWGIDDAVQVVVYDDAGGIYAARLWWMLRWLGHTAVAVLDGGWFAWQSEGYPTRSGVEQRMPRPFVPRLHPHMLATTDEIAGRLGTPDLHLFDVRAAARYCGESETLDPVAGHIPGAVNAPYTMNLDAAGCFVSTGELRERYEALLGDVPVEEAIFYCGSGVSAVHTLIALEYAGLGLARLYAGSWSEWIAQVDRPVATGAQP